MKTLIKNGRIVTAVDDYKADILIENERVSIIGGSLDMEADHTIDAAGKLVIPGGIDPHIHCGMPILGGPSNEQILAAPPSQVSKAALYGGTTTMLDFALCPPDQPLRQLIEERQRERGTQTTQHRTTR